MKDLTHPGLKLADDALSADDGVGFDLLEANGQVLDFDFEGLLDGFDFDDALLLFVEDLYGVLELGLDALVPFVADAEFLGNFLVVASQGGQFLFDLSPGG